MTERTVIGRYEIVVRGLAMSSSPIFNDRPRAEVEAGAARMLAAYGSRDKRVTWHRYTDEGLVEVVSLDEVLS